MRHDKAAQHTNAGVLLTAAHHSPVQTTNIYTRHFFSFFKETTQCWCRYNIQHSPVMLLSLYFTRKVEASKGGKINKTYISSSVLHKFTSYVQKTNDSFSKMKFNLVFQFVADLCNMCQNRLQECDKAKLITVTFHKYQRRKLEQCSVFLRAKGKSCNLNRGETPYFDTSQIRDTSLSQVYR